MVKGKISLIFIIIFSFMIMVNGSKALGRTNVSTSGRGICYGDIAHQYIDVEVKNKSNASTGEVKNSFIDSIISLTSLIVALAILAFIIIKSELEKGKL